MAQRLIPNPAAEPRVHLQRGTAVALGRGTTWPLPQWEAGAQRAQLRAPGWRQQAGT